MTKKLALLAAGLLVSAVPVLAHHSFAAEFDANKPVTQKGTITKVEWMNPHVYFYFDATDASGKVTNWAVEVGTPIQLYRAGWREDTLKVGDLVTVQGYLAKEEALHRINGRNVTLPDGRRVFFGSNYGASARNPSE